jgi:hypothetical protein
MTNHADIKDLNEGRSRTLAELSKMNEEDRRAALAADEEEGDHCCSHITHMYSLRLSADEEAGEELEDDERLEDHDGNRYMEMLAKVCESRSTLLFLPIRSREWKRFVRLVLLSQTTTTILTMTCTREPCQMSTSGAVGTTPSKVICPDNLF